MTTNKDYNAVCRICGKPYHQCTVCRDKDNKIMHYKQFACSPNCFKIYATITSTNSKIEQKESLLKCDLSVIKAGDKEIQDYIAGVMSVEEKKENVVNVTETKKKVIGNK